MDKTMSKAVFVKLTHLGEDYATIELHVATSVGGKTLTDVQVPKSVGEWLEENGAYDD